MTHKTQTTYDGDRVIYHCHTCGYTRVQDRATGQWTVTNPGDQDALHSGGSGGVSMTASVDAGPIPEDYHVDADAVNKWLNGEGRGWAIYSWN